MTILFLRKARKLRKEWLFLGAFLPDHPGSSLLALLLRVRLFSKYCHDPGNGTGEDAGIPSSQDFLASLLQWVRLISSRIGSSFSRIVVLSFRKHLENSLRMLLPNQPPSDSGGLSCKGKLHFKQSPQGLLIPGVESGSTGKRFDWLGSLKGTLNTRLPHFRHQLPVQGVPQTTATSDNSLEGPPELTENYYTWTVAKTQLWFVTEKG